MIIPIGLLSQEEVTQKNCFARMKNTCLLQLIKHTIYTVAALSNILKKQKVILKRWLKLCA